MYYYKVLIWDLPLLEFVLNMHEKCPPRRHAFVVNENASLLSMRTHPCRRGGQKRLYGEDIED